MIDTTGIDRDTERQETATMYVGKRLYLYLVEIQKVLHDASRNELVTAEDLGVFAELDVKSLIEQAAEIGKVPKWNDEKLAKFEYKTDVYRDRN